MTSLILKAKNNDMLVFVRSLLAGRYTQRNNLMVFAQMDEMTDLCQDVGVTLHWLTHRDIWER